MVKVDSAHFSGGNDFPHFGHAVSSEASTFSRLTFLRGAWAAILAQAGVVEIVGQGTRDQMAGWIPPTILNECNRLP